MLRVSSGFQTLENNKTTRPAALWFQMFLTFGNLMNPSHSFLKYYLKIIVRKTSTVPPESIDPFAAFLPRGLHASMTQCSRTRPRLYLGKTEDGIRPAAAAFWTRYYLGNKDASTLSSILFPSCFFLTKPV